MYIFFGKVEVSNLFLARLKPADTSRLKHLDKTKDVGSQCELLLIVLTNRDGE